MEMNYARSCSKQSENQIATSEEPATKSHVANMHKDMVTVIRSPCLCKVLHSTRRTGEKHVILIRKFTLLKEIITSLLI